MLAFKPGTFKPGELTRFAETLLYSAVGGGAAGLAGLPAGWLWGGFLSVMVAALAGRSVFMPKWVASMTFVYLGILLGGAITPDSLGAMAKWPLSLACLAVAMVAITGLVALYLRFIHGWDGLSAIFASAPGALSQSLALAASTGADVRSVAMVQSVRIVVYTAGLPAILGTAARHNLPPPVPFRLATYSFSELSVLIASCVVASAIAHRLAIPGGLIVGSMVVSGVLHGSALVHVNPPEALSNMVFLCLGALVGTRFAGVDLYTMRKMAVTALGALVVGTVAAFGCAFAAAQLLNIRMSDMFLAYVPGGLEAMTILAFALKLDPAFVGAHHLARYVLLMALLPVVSVWLRPDKPAQD